MTTTMLDVTPRELENYGSVWKELLKIKIDILYKISLEKKEDFAELLGEFLPEALEDEYKHLLGDKYILNKPPKKILFGKKKNETENIDVKKDKSDEIREEISHDKKDKPVEVREEESIINKDKSIEIIEEISNDKKDNEVKVIKEEILVEKDKPVKIREEVANDIKDKPAEIREEVANDKKDKSVEVREKIANDKKNNPEVVKQKMKKKQFNITRRAE